MIAALTTAACASDDIYSEKLQLEPDEGSTLQFGGNPPALVSGPLRLLSAHTIHGRNIGGISAMVADGDELTLFSDRGASWRTSLSRDDQDVIQTLDQWRPLTMPALPLNERDIESAVLTEDGVLLAFERDHALVPLRSTNNGFELKTEPFRPAFLQNAPDNGGVEAMATIGESTLAIAEQHFNAQGLARAAWLSDGQEIEAAYRNSDGFSATAADATANHLFVVERSLTFLGGWLSNIVVIPLADIDEGSSQAIQGRGLIPLPSGFPVDNMEALSAKALPTNKVELLILSDDNFIPFQDTLLLQIEIDLNALLG